MDKYDAWPTEIRLRKDGRSVGIQFTDGMAADLPAEFLRVLSPSAEVQGHSPEQRQTVGGKINVSVSAIEPVGNYAVRLVFSDGHDTGLYSWRYLRKLCAEQSDLWVDYCAELEAKGLRREE